MAQHAKGKVTTTQTPAKMGTSVQGKPIVKKKKPKNLAEHTRSLRETLRM